MNKIAFKCGMTHIYKADVFTSVLYLIFFTLLFIVRLEQNFISIGNITLVLLGILTQGYLYCKLRANCLYIKFQTSYLLFIVLMCMNFMLVHNLEIKALLHGMITLPALAILIYFFDYKTWVYLLPFGCVSFLIIYKWFILGLGPDEVTINSRNYLVFYLFLYVMPYFLHCYRLERMPSIIFPVFFLIISILAIGRGGIIMSVILLIGWLCMLLKTTNHKFLILFIIAGLIIYTTYISVLSENFELLFSRFEERGLESTSRTDAWAQYVQYSCTSIDNFLFGTNTNSVPLVRNLNRSIHNSYLTSHAYLGIFFILYIYLAVKGYIVFIKQKQYFMIAFFGALFIKAFVDADFPCTAVGGDIYMCILIINGINYKYFKYHNS